MTFRIVILNRRNAKVDEIAADSEQEAREVALAQSDCDGQRSWKFHVYDGNRRVARYENGRECVDRPPKPPAPVRTKSYSVGIYTTTGVHHDTLPMDSESDALTFAVMKWRQFGFRTFEFRVYEAFEGSGQRHLAGRFRRGRRLKQ